MSFRWESYTLLYDSGLGYKVELWWIFTYILTWMVLLKEKNKKIVFKNLREIVMRHYIASAQTVIWNLLKYATVFSFRAFKVFLFFLILLSNIKNPTIKNLYRIFIWYIMLWLFIAFPCNSGILNKLHSCS